MMPLFRSSSQLAQGLHVTEATVGLQVHLRDGWMGTPVQPGDTVHVLAHVDVAQGQAHAICDHAAGAQKTPRHPIWCLWLLS